MRKVSRFLYWTPRVLSIIIIAFMALMSLDIFGNGYGFWGTIVGLFMHNIPALILLIVLLISWKYEILGGIIFIIAGLTYTLLTLAMNKFEWYLLAWTLEFAGIAFFIGILFLIGWFKKKKAEEKEKLKPNKRKIKRKNKK